MVSALLVSDCSLNLLYLFTVNGLWFKICKQYECCFNFSSAMKSFSCEHYNIQCVNCSICMHITCITWIMHTTKAMSVAVYNGISSICIHVYTYDTHVYMCVCIYLGPTDNPCKGLKLKSREVASNHVYNTYTRK